MNELKLYCKHCNHLHIEDLNESKETIEIYCEKCNNRLGKLTKKINGNDISIKYES